MTVFGCNLSPTAAYYSVRNWIYSISSSKCFWAGITSLIYIFLLIWFAHIDVIIDCYKNNIIEISDITDKVVYKHAHLLSLLTNLGLLSMLFIDLLMANKYEGAISLTLLNLVGVFSMVCVFWYAVGCEPNVVNSIGGLGSTTGSLCALAVFVFTLLCLKYIAIKPTE